MRQTAIWLFLCAVGLLLLGAPAWLLFAVAASALLGLMILLDAVFLDTEDDGGMYVNEWEPMVVSGFMQLTPWIIVPWFVDVRWVDGSALAMVSGVLYMSSLVFYFRAMKEDPNAVVMAVMWNITVLAVPIFALVIGETLSFSQYVGIVFLFLGAVLCVWEKTKVRLRVVWLMAFAVTVCSIHLVVEEVALGESVDWDSFWNIFLFFTLGEGIVALISLGVIARSKVDLVRLGGIVRSFWPRFIFVEFCQIAYVTASWRAVSLGLVSVVTAIEALSAGFVIVLSVAMARMLRGTGYQRVGERARDKHMAHIRMRTIGIVVSVVGAYLVVG